MVGSGTNSGACSRGMACIPEASGHAHKMDAQGLWDEERTPGTDYGDRGETIDTGGRLRRPGADYGDRKQTSATRRLWRREGDAPTMPTVTAVFRLRLRA